MSFLTRLLSPFISAVLLSIPLSEIALAKDELGADFFREITELKSQKEIPELAKGYGFTQETDPDRLNFFQSKELDTTIQILSPNGLYVSIRDKNFEQACNKAKAMADAVLEKPKSSKNEPYWPEQATLISSWKGQGKQGHVSLYCEQYGQTGSSNIGISITFKKQ